MSLKVSVIIPAYNVEDKISACLQSVLDQTYHNKEIIVVNDGSTDYTAEICDRFQRDNQCIKVIHQLNSGVSVARNVALMHATGEYIVFVDSDDTIFPEYIEELMKWSEYDFVTAGYNWQTPELSWKKRIFEEDSISQIELKAFPSKYMGKYYFGSPWATLMKRRIINDKNIRFDEHIHCGEDILFIFQYLKYAKNIKIVPYCGYNYFFYPGSLVNTKHEEFWKWKIQVESEIRSFFKPCNEFEKESLLSRCFDVLRDLLRDYYGHMTKEEFFALYKNPFFTEAILYKKNKQGKISEKILIFAMDHKNYRIYLFWKRIEFFFYRLKNKLRRTFNRRSVK